MINYLAGETVADAGITSGTGGLTRGIHKYPININGQHCVVSDTEGLESSHSKFWQNLMKKELLVTDANKTISDWYHIVVYCIGANGGRVQDIEIDMLRRLSEAGYGVIVAFTKADLASDEELIDLEDAIENAFNGYSGFHFIPICSKKTRSSQLEGKEELSSAILDAWGDSIMNRLPEMVYAPVIDSLSGWVNNTTNWIRNQEIGFGIFTQTKRNVLNKLNNKVRNDVEQMADSIEYRKTQAFQDVSNVYSMLNIVLDAQSLADINTAFNNKIEKLKLKSVFESNAIRNSGLAIGGCCLLLITPLAPFLALFVGAGAWIIKTSDKDKRKEEMVNAYVNQAMKIQRSFIEQKYALKCSIAAMLGYIIGYRELGICYLKGRGIEQNVVKFADCIREIINFSNENESFTDPISEYYIGYASYLNADKENTNHWFKLASEHGNENAEMIIHGKDINYVESLNDSEYEKSWEKYSISKTKLREKNKIIDLQMTKLKKKNKSNVQTLPVDANSGAETEIESIDVDKNGKIDITSWNIDDFKEDEKEINKGGPCDNNVSESNDKPNHVSNKKGLIITLLVTIVILLAAVLVFFFVRENPKKGQSVQQQSTQLQPNQKQNVTYTKGKTSKNNFDMNKVKLFIQEYSRANAENDYDVIRKLYASKVRRYHDEYDTDRDFVLKCYKEYDDMFGVYGKHSDVRWNTLETELVGNEIYVTYIEDYSIDRYDKSKYSKFVLEKHIVLNDAYEVVSVYDVQLKRGK